MLINPDSPPQTEAQTVALRCVVLCSNSNAPRVLLPMRNVVSFPLASLKACTVLERLELMDVVYHVPLWADTGLFTHTAVVLQQNGIASNLIRATDASRAGYFHDYTISSATSMTLVSR